MIKSRKRSTILVGLTAAVTLFIALASLVRSPITDLEVYSRDLRTRYGRKTPVNTNLVFLGIYPNVRELLNPEEIEASSALKLMAQNYPWPRDVWAMTIDKLLAAGARVVALDLVFASESQDDEAFKQALARHRERTVVAWNLVDIFEEGKRRVEFQVPFQGLIGTADPIFDQQVGFINLWADFDGVIRSAKFWVTENELENLVSITSVGQDSKRKSASFASRILEKSGLGDRVPPDSSKYHIRYTSKPSDKIRPRGLYEIFLPNYWEKNFGNGAFFKDKIVVIGPAANIFQDYHLSPFGKEMLGPEIHLQIVNAAIHREFIDVTGPVLDVMLVALGTILAWLMTLLVYNPLVRLVAAVGTTAAYAGVSMILGNFENLYIATAGPIIALNVNTILILAYEYISEQLERLRLRRTLERYVSRDVVRELVDNPTSFLNSLVGLRKPMTILFSDVRNFTTITEGADPAPLVKQLNEYFKEMVSIVFAHDGTLDKFIGDAVMAEWGGIKSFGIQEDACRAVSTALHMKKALAKLNKDWESRGMLKLAVGFGLNHGEAIIGNLGSEEKMEVSVIGDPVNTASRLEGMTKKYHLDLLIGDSVAQLVRDRFVLRTVDLVQPKGKTKPLEIFTVIAAKDEKEGVPGWLPDYEKGVQAFRTRHFKLAIELMEKVLSTLPDDYLAGLYLKWSQDLLLHPPAEDWNGVSVFTEK